MASRRAVYLLLAALLPAPAVASAATLEVAAGGGNLARALRAAAPGDTLRLAPGEHWGPIAVDRPLVLEGREGAVVRGDGHGVVVTVTAPDVTLRGLEITGSGISLEAMDAGVRLERTAARAVVEGSRMSTT
jgi:nitrous oxidase accessory protein